MGQVVWEELDGPPSGNARVVCVDSSGTVFAFAGYSRRNVCRYDPIAKSWTSLSRIGNVQAAAVGPDGTIYAALSPDYRIDKLSLIRSTDHGYTWSNVLVNYDTGCAVAVNRSGIVFYASDSLPCRIIPNDATPRPILIRPGSRSHPSNRILHYFIDELGDVFAGTRSGVFVSHDDGVSWDSVGKGMAGVAVYSVLATANGDVFAGSDSLVYRLRKGDSVWVPLLFTGTGPFRLATTANGRIIAASFHERVFVSDSVGEVWTQHDVSGLQALDVVLGPRGELFVASAVYGMFQSVDNGTTWNIRQGGFGKVVVQTLLITRTGRMIAGIGDSYTRSGNVGQIVDLIMTSDDSGRTWDHVPIFPFPMSVWCSALLPDGSILVGNERNGLLRSTDDGHTWQWWNAALGRARPRVLAILPINSALTFMGTDSAVLRSTDNGVTWSRSLKVNEGVWSLVLHPSGRLLAGCGAGVIYYSDDQGTNWTRLVNRVAGTDIQQMAVRRSGEIYAATFQSGMFRSLDTGKTWKYLGMKDTLCFAVLVGRGGDVLVGTNGTVKRSTDKGDTWQNAALGLSGQTINNFTVDSSGVVYAATWYGIARTRLPSYASVESLSNSAFRDDGPNVSVVPNPVVGQSSVRVRTGRTAHVRAALYTLLGEEVSALCDVDLPPGDHDFPLSSSRFPCGSYICRVCSGDEVRTMRVIIGNR